VLSTSTWKGLGADANWSTSLNWDTVPTAGSNIVFPAGASQLTNTDDLGPGLSFGTLTLSGGGYTISPGNGSTASFTSIDSSQTSSTNTINVPIALTAATSVTVDNSAATLVLGGVVSGSFGIIKAGSGTLDLTADSTYTGSTAVNAGSLFADGDLGASSVTIASGAKLGGVGTVGAISATGGTVDPGNPPPGILTDAGDLGLAVDSSSNNSTFSVVLDGTTPGSGKGGYSQVKAAGTIALSGVNLTAALGPDFVPALGSQYTIIDNTGSSFVTGTFNNQADGSVVQIGGMPFTISYGGGSSSNSVVLTEVDQSQTAVTFSPASPVFGQSVGLTATVSGPAGSPTPTGNVQFLNGTTSLGTVALASGTAALNVTLPVAANSITAKYTGDTNFTGSTSPAVTVTVAQSESSTTLIPSTTTPVFGQSVTLSATVQAVAPGTGVPTGTVQFFNGTTSLGMATIASGTGSIATSALALGANSITVKYSGDTDFKGQTSTATTVTVGQASTTANITSTPSSPSFGQAVMITATVVPISPGTGTPTGTVQFLNGSTSLGTATLSSGAGSITTSTLPSGTNTITVIYSGDTDFKGSTSTGSVAIGQTASSTSLTVSNPNPSATQSVTFTANVTAVSSGAGTPTGTVEFLDASGNSFGSATLKAGVATLTTTLPIAVNSVTAQYSGDANFSSSTSNTVSVDVGTPNEEWLNKTFMILLNRPLTSAEVPYWDKQFAKGRSRYSIANEISNGKEARNASVQDAFMVYLGRNGTPVEVKQVVRTANATNTSVQAAILGSRLFYNQSGGTYTTYFQGLLTAVFGTTFPDVQIERMLSAGVPRILVAHRLLQSDLGRQSVLTFAYNAVLKRDPTQPEVALYLSQMKHENVLLRSIVVTLLASSEFYVRATSPA
jgi:autotransporter-associated beta strand protein